MPHLFKPFAIFGFFFYLSLIFGSMAMMNIGAGLFLLVTLPSYLRSKGWKQTPRTAQWLTCFLLAACWMSLIGAQIFPLYYANRTFTANEGFSKAWYILLGSVVTWIFQQATFLERRRFITFWIFSAGAYCFFGLIQIFTGFCGASVNPTIPGLFQTTLLFKHHLSTASICIFPFFVSLSLSLHYKNMNRTLFWTFGLSSLLMGIILFFTWSRSLWMALPIGCMVWACHTGPLYFKIARSWVLATFGLFTVTAVALLLQIPAITDRLISTLGASDRWYLWRANWDFFLRRPIFGIGFRKSEFLVSAYFEEHFPNDWKHLFTGHAHNMWMENLATIGLVGSLAYVLWCSYIMKIALTLSTHDPKSYQASLAWGMFCAWIVFHLNGLTQVNFWEGKCLHQTMFSAGVLFGLHSVSQKSEASLS
jgi:O-antigen ligase